VKRAELIGMLVGLTAALCCFFVVFGGAVPITTWDKPFPMFPAISYRVAWAGFLGVAYTASIVGVIASYRARDKGGDK